MPDGKDPDFSCVLDEEEDWSLAKSLQTPDKIRILQRKLYLKAKAAPDYRLYLLYDKLYHVDIPHQAYDLTRANNGARMG